MADNFYTKLPKSQQFAAGAAIAVVVGVGFYFAWYEGQATERDSLLKKLAELNAQVAELNVVKARLPELQKEVDMLGDQLAQLRRILPPAKETPDLMKRLQSLASQSNLKIKAFTPGQTAQKEFYLEWPLEIQVEATYANLATFFERVGRLPRIVNIGNLRTAASTKPSFTQTLTAQYTAMTYVYSEPVGKPKAKK